MLYALSRDKVLPAVFGVVHPKRKVPHHTIAFQTVVTIALTLVAFGSFYTLLFLLIPLVLVMYTLVLAAYIKIKAAGVSGSFRFPLGSRGALLLIVMNTFLVAAWALHAPQALLVLVMGALLVVIGFPLYIIIKLYTDRSFVEQFYNGLSVVWEPLFSLWYSETEASVVVRNASLSPSSHVLDYGCGTGTTTGQLVRRVPAGMVIGIDISEQQLRKAEKKFRGRGNIVLMKDHAPRLEPASVDAVTAVGVLEHLENPSKTIRQLLATVRPGGTFSFLCFGKSFGIVGSPHFADEDRVRSLFRDVDVTLHVRKEHKKFTQYWYMWGQKK